MDGSDLDNVAEAFYGSKVRNQSHDLFLSLLTPSMSGKGLGRVRCISNSHACEPYTSRSSYWSRLNGNGTITWGPDGEISPLGVKQAEKVHDLWKRESYAHIPIPTRVFSSPLSRAAHTLRITFSGLMDLQKHPPMIMEGLRERIGVHTCDLRSSKSEIHRAFPEFVFEDGFVEEDVLWKADVREKDDEKDARLKTVLDSIFTIEDTCEWRIAPCPRRSD